MFSSGGYTGPCDIVHARCSVGPANSHHEMFWAPPMGPYVISFHLCRKYSRVFLSYVPLIFLEKCIRVRPEFFSPYILCAKQILQGLPVLLLNASQPNQPWISQTIEFNVTYDTGCMYKWNINNYTCANMIQMVQLIHCSRLIMFALILRCITMFHCTIE